MPRRIFFLNFLLTDSFSSFLSAQSSETRHPISRPGETRDAWLNSKQINFRPRIFQIHQSVMSGSGIQMTQELVRTHADKALDDITDLPEEDAKDALLKMVNLLKA